MSKIQLILQVESFPEFEIHLNGQPVIAQSWYDEQNNLRVVVNEELKETNVINMIVHKTENPVKLEEIIIDGIRFGLVTFLCTTVNKTQNTQINTNGSIDIEISIPVWKFWCDKMQDFNYERYPLGSTA